MKIENSNEMFIVFYKVTSEIVSYQRSTNKYFVELRVLLNLVVSVVAIILRTRYVPFMLYSPIVWTSESQLF